MKTATPITRRKTELPLCLCGCQQRVKHRKRRYATRFCMYRDPTRREERKRICHAAGRAAKAAFDRRLTEHTERYPSKVDAYKAGYRSGWQNAYRYWRAKYERVVRENNALRRGEAA